MKKRWWLNLILLGLVASLVAFLYLRPKSAELTNEVYELSSYKLSEFNAISVEFPTKAAVTFEKKAGLWRLTAPYQTRADQASVQRILAIVAASSPEKFTSNDLEKFGLNNPAVKLKLIRSSGNFEEFLFGAHNPITGQQYALHKNSVYLIEGTYSEAAATQAIEMVDKSPLNSTEKVAGFDFSRLEQWEASKLNVDLVDGHWSVSIPKAKPVQNELNEWLDYNWVHSFAKSVELYTPDRKVTYPSFEVKLADGTKVHFDKIQESPELVLARPDEGLKYSFASDVGFVMLNPPINLPN
ncbi:MAG: DUF4340 domain-containing protein [Methylotenera sp.]|nr:DUF4340 domain-containing protein [Methylotenera sp.]